ncbi:hypothetical protein [Mameliella alba]|uniref:hypothetical protein n=1 Tax=Mameliella alba TaxID=561184 RepID=UPI001430F720|nr:hypothetical protein [Mameliella alba]
MVIEMEQREAREAQILQTAERIKEASELPLSGARNSELAALAGRLAELVTG